MTSCVDRLPVGWNLAGNWPFCIIGECDRTTKLLKFGVCGISVVAIAGTISDLDIEFMTGTEVSVGLGDPATTVVGPAIGNAIFAAVGARVRHLPITSEAVRLAMAAAN